MSRVEENLFISQKVDNNKLDKTYKNIDYFIFIIDYHAV